MKSFTVTAERADFSPRSSDSSYSLKRMEELMFFMLAFLRYSSSASYYGLCSILVASYALLMSSADTFRVPSRLTAQALTNFSPKRTAKLTMASLASCVA